MVNCQLNCQLKDDNLYWIVIPGFIFIFIKLLFIIIIIKYIAREKRIAKTNRSLLWRRQRSDNQLQTRQYLFFVNLKQGSNVDKVLKITQLGRHRVTMERARRRKECYSLKCHIFRHLTNYCLQNPICGKCAGSHVTRGHAFSFLNISILTLLV